ncbi:MAG TPA: 2-C-methyl-D-erythritol 4-phosphate cytidylyltransferase, partial [Bacteroidales bacterium]|nr:2-C-methyl-D-erythritol 4-phosphate cytidylyltransferase [Bacteroidales bacterium]
MVYAIILSGGVGTRFGNQLPKQFLKINNKTILEYSIETFETHNLIDKIIIVSNPNFIKKTKEILAKNNYKKVCAIISGGNTRGESSYLGLKQINETENSKDKIKVLIHDSVRPNTSNKIISEIIKGFDEFKALSPAIKTTDTIYI